MYMLEVIAFLFSRTIQFNAKDAFGTLGNNVIHLLFPLFFCPPMDLKLSHDAACSRRDVDYSVVIETFAGRTTCSPSDEIAAHADLLPGPLFSYASAQCVAHFFLFGPSNR